MKKQILFFVLIVLLSGCTYFGQNKPQKEYFTLWNTCEALTALQAYVEDVTNPQSPNFIPSWNTAHWMTQPSLPRQM